jgi:hypothetical protein
MHNSTFAFILDQIKNYSIRLSWLMLINSNLIEIENNSIIGNETFLKKSIRVNFKNNFVLLYDKNY